MSILKRLLFLCFACFLSFSAPASVVMPDDGPYYRLRRDRNLYIYDDSSRESLEQIAAYMRVVRLGYDQSFNWKLDEEADLVLTSPAQQITNAYATVVPNIKSVWYPSGGDAIDSMAAGSWGLLLTAHETAHLYQLNAKSEVPAALKTVVGNAITITPFIWPIFIHPNILTPTFLLEGNAVLNESRANIGGRLHSGEARALVLAQIQAGQINPNRLINNQLRFPYGQNPYLQGAYFQAHLASKYGVDKTNQFFLAQGSHYLWPLILNKTFRDHFGSSYPQEIREYVREMDALAKNQKSTPGQALSEGEFISPLNHDKNNIYYLITNGRRLPRLEVINKKTLRLTSETRDLPMGKVFWIDNEPEAAASEMHDLHHIEYSLYGDGKRFDANYRGQIVNDIRGGKTASLAAFGTWLDPRVLINGESFDVGHSQPILDEEGNVFYFRQNGATRMLYKNRQPVFKFEGFYAKALEVDAEGTFYFIGNTDYGSTLYQYKNNEISRVLKSDRVIDARHIRGDEFLIVEVGADGYAVKTTRATPASATPVNYSYGFPSYNLVADKVADSEQTKVDERPYNSLREMRYSSMDLGGSYDSSSGFGGLLGLNFVDPMEYQAVSLLYAGTQFRDENLMAQYTFTKYLPQIFVNYLYTRQFWKQHDGVERKAYNQRAMLGVELPVLRWRNWDAVLLAAPTYEKRDKYLDPTAPATLVRPDERVEETYGVQSGASVQYQESTAVGMYPWRLFRFDYLNRLAARSEEWTKKYNTSLAQTKFQQGFPIQFYASLSGGVAWAENHDVDVSYDPMPMSYQMRIPRLTSHETFVVQTASFARFEFTKVFDVGLYSPRIPVGMTRVAPVVVAQGLFLDNKGNGHNDYPANTFEWGYGADVELLVLHTFRANIRYLMAFDTRTPETSESQAQFNLHQSF